MSAINLLNQSDVGSIINGQKMSNAKEKKTIKSKTRNKPGATSEPAQDIDVPKYTLLPIVNAVTVIEEQPKLRLVKKPKKTRVCEHTTKIDAPSVNVDSEETENISLKRKRGRPPKCKNEIAKSNWLGFFAFVAENGYFDAPK